MKKVLSSKKENTKLVLLLIFLVLAGCQTTPAEPVKIVAQPILRCAPTSEVILFLKQKFNEDPVYTGVYENKIIFTIFVSPSNSFTVVHTGAANEISCLVSSGTNFKKISWKEKKSI
jgi:hypothetical protein|tara:strand:+ start:656 stop:1006 length:351 start_codon:yes stop_codon:yes gene_type:complete